MLDNLLESRFAAGEVSNPGRKGWQLVGCCQWNMISVETTSYTVSYIMTKNQQKKNHSTLSQLWSVLILRCRLDYLYKEAQCLNIRQVLKEKECGFVFTLWCCPHAVEMAVWDKKVVLRLENAHFCLKSWCQQIIFSLDLFWVAHDTTKIGPFFRK